MAKLVNTVFGKLPVYWRLATFRCALYAGIVGWGVFKAGVNGFDSVSAMTPLQFWELMGDVAQAMFGVWLAFIDNTISKVQDGDKSGDTQFLARQIPPAITPGGNQEKDK